MAKWLHISCVPSENVTKSTQIKGTRPIEKIDFQVQDEKADRTFQNKQDQRSFGRRPTVLQWQTAKDLLFQLASV